MYLKHQISVLEYFTILPFLLYFDLINAVLLNISDKNMKKGKLLKGSVHETVIPCKGRIHDEMRESE